MLCQLDKIILHARNNKIKELSVRKFWKHLVFLFETVFSFVRVFVHLSQKKNSLVMPKLHLVHKVSQEAYQFQKVLRAC